MQAEHQIKPFPTPSNAQRALATSAVAAIVVGSGAVAYFDPSKANFLPVCPLYALTGFACPGCGLTRGFHALFHGDVLTALDLNALIPVWVLIFGYLSVSLLLFAVRGKGLQMWVVKPAFLFVLMGVLIAFGVLRNIPAWPFSILFP